MSRTLKILLIIAVIFSFAFTINYVLATSDEDNSSDRTENITNNNTSDNESQNVISENVSDSSSLSSLSASNGTRVEPINSYSEANLQLNNILSIILISIGVLLVLFAIALLIRIKK